MTGYSKYYIGPFSPSDPNPNHITNLNLTNGGCCDATFGRQLPNGSVYLQLQLVNGLVKLLAFNAHICPSKYLVYF